MSLPSAVFLDTSIFAGQQYNFESTAFTTFIPVAQKIGLRLVLPDPTEREINRQIKERSNATLKALEEARHRAPFLAKWQHFPKDLSDWYSNWEISKVARDECERFFSQLEIIRLGYEDVHLPTIMNWYDSITAPFREGKKRKEFPDALAIAILETYARKNNIFIAVVSEDLDFKGACARYPSLLYFKSLPQLTELLLAEPKRIAELKDSISADLSEFGEAIAEAFDHSSFVHDRDDINIDGATLTNVDIGDMNIVAMGGNECTVTFEAEIEAEYQLSWSETGVDGEVKDENWLVTDAEPVTGTAKMILDEDGKQIQQITFLEFDDPIIYVTASPY